MHPRIMAERNALAQQRLLKAADVLARRFKIDDGKIAALRVQSGDPLLRQMREREAMADILEALAEKTEVKTVETAPEAVAEEVVAFEEQAAPIEAKVEAAKAPKKSRKAG